MNYGQMAVQLAEIVEPITGAVPGSAFVRGRKKQTVNARFIIIVLMREEGATQQQIAAALKASIDRSTVANAIARIRDFAKYDRPFREMLDKARKTWRERQSMEPTKAELQALMKAAYGPDRAA